MNEILRIRNEGSTTRLLLHKLRETAVKTGQCFQWKPACGPSVWHRVNTDTSTHRLSNAHTAHKGRPISHSIRLVILRVLVSLDCTAYHEQELKLGSPASQWQSTRETPCARGDLSGNDYTRVGQQQGLPPGLRGSDCSTPSCAVTSFVLR